MRIKESRRFASKVVGRSSSYSLWDKLIETERFIRKRFFISPKSNHYYGMVIMAIIKWCVGLSVEVCGRFLSLMYNPISDLSMPFDEFKEAEFIVRLALERGRRSKGKVVRLGLYFWSKWPVPNFSD